MVAAQSGVPGDVEAGAKVLGSPARPMAQASRIVAAQARLPELLQRVRALEHRLEDLASQARAAAGGGSA